ncbi:HTH domain-containing protein [Aquimarina muelleri]|nr:HTH domain-containing protein [Aquimarina muelleri]
MERIDQLIRMKATGNPEELAKRLGISKTKLYRTIRTMKALNAPLEYDYSIQSYVYIKTVGFKFGFFVKERKTKDIHSFLPG